MSIPPIFTFNSGTYGCVKPSTVSLTSDFTICNGNINPAVFNVPQYYNNSTTQNDNLVLTNPSQSGMPKTMYCIGAGINTSPPGPGPYMLCATKPISINRESYAQVTMANQTNNSNQIAIVILIILIIVIIFMVASRKNIFL